MAQLIRHVSQPWSPTRVGDELLAALRGPYTRLSARIGFVNASGVRHLADALEAWRSRGSTSRVLVGVDGTVTSAAGVRALHRLVDELWLFRHPGRPLCHPKTYVLDGPDRALALTGSANLTESALWVNYEDLAVIEMSLVAEVDAAQLTEYLDIFDASTSSPNAHLADDYLIGRVEAMGLLPNELERRRAKHEREAVTDSAAAEAEESPLFPPSAVSVPPKAKLLPEERQDARSPTAGGQLRVEPIAERQPAAEASHTAFVLRLGTRDVRARRGYSREVYIPMAAYRSDTAFWGDMAPKVTDRGKRYDERRVMVEFRRQSGAVERDDRRLYRYYDKSELRLNARQVSEDAEIGDLLVLERAAAGLGVEYVATVVKPSDPLFAGYDEVAANDVPRSDKRWGYV